MASEGVFPKSTGDRIYQADYNAIQSLIAGVKTTYYGVASTSAQLSGKPAIDHTQVNNLLTDIDSCITHQTGSVSGLTTKSQGATISHLDFNNLYTYANQANTNKDTVYASSQLAQVSDARTSNHAGGGWNTSLVHTVRVNWASANDASYFFQTGGYLYATASSSGGTGSSKDNSWSALIGTVGTRPYTRTNWNAGGTTVIAKLYASVYGANYWQLSVTKDSSSQVTMTMTFQDDAGPNVLYDELVYLNITSSVGYYKSVGAVTGAYPNNFTNITTI